METWCERGGGWVVWVFFFFNDTATTEIYTLSLHDALPIYGWFANFVLPLQIGARDMASPLLNMISFWLYVLAGIIVLSGFFVEGGAAAAGWTSYPPLSALAGMGQTLWIIGVMILGLSSIMGSINYITTFFKLRAPVMAF